MIVTRLKKEYEKYLIPLVLESRDSPDRQYVEGLFKSENSIEYCLFLYGYRFRSKADLFKNAIGYEAREACRIDFLDDISEHTKEGFYFANKQNISELLQHNRDGKFYCIHKEDHSLKCFPDNQRSNSDHLVLFRRRTFKMKDKRDKKILEFNSNLGFRYTFTAKEFIPLFCEHTRSLPPRFKFKRTDQILNPGYPGPALVFITRECLGVDMQYYVRGLRVECYPSATDWIANTDNPAANVEESGGSQVRAQGIEGRACMENSPNDPERCSARCTLTSEANDSFNAYHFSDSSMVTQMQLQGQEQDFVGDFSKLLQISNPQQSLFESIPPVSNSKQNQCTEWTPRLSKTLQNQSEGISTNKVETSNLPSALERRAEWISIENSDALSVASSTTLHSSSTRIRNSFDYRYSESDNLSVAQESTTSQVKLERETYTIPSYGGSSANQTRDLGFDYEKLFESKEVHRRVIDSIGTPIQSELGIQQRTKHKLLQHSAASNYFHSVTGVRLRREDNPISRVGELLNKIKSRALVARYTEVQCASGKVQFAVTIKQTASTAFL